MASLLNVKSSRAYFFIKLSLGVTLFRDIFKEPLTKGATMSMMTNNPAHLLPLQQVLIVASPRRRSRLKARASSQIVEASYY
jgi:hypothetical protein